MLLLPLAAGVLEEATVVGAEGRKLLAVLLEACA
jgi:hypothetical protein